MTEKKFVLAEEKLLAEIPQEFRLFVSAKAYEDGHSSGFQEILGCVQDLVAGLKEPCKQFEKRILDGKRSGGRKGN